MNCYFANYWTFIGHNFELTHFIFAYHRGGSSRPLPCVHHHANELEAITSFNTITQIAEIVCHESQLIIIVTPSNPLHQRRPRLNHPSLTPLPLSSPPTSLLQTVIGIAAAVAASSNLCTAASDAVYPSVYSTKPENKTNTKIISS